MPAKTKKASSLRQKPELVHQFLVALMGTAIRSRSFAAFSVQRSCINALVAYW
jgi:hypothetical protein